MASVVDHRSTNVALAFRLLDRAISAPKPEAACKPTAQDLADMGRDLAHFQAEHDERMRQEGREDARRQFRRTGHPSFEALD